MIGGAALIVAAAGAATAGGAIGGGHTTDAAATAATGGGYVANLSSASLEGRDATRISRAGARPQVTATASARDKAAETIAARNEKLREAANDAEKYAKELSSDEWVYPTTGYHISTWFGEAGPYWSSGYHTGIDFATAYGTPVVAVTNAVVVQTGWDGPYGNQIRLQLENGDEVWYNHLSSIEVTVGQSVLKSEEIGRVGETGNAYGYHLHFEYRLASDLHTGVDPKPYFEEHGIPLS
jgi:murein DD-endopeptidase MepM/ murein hydrolase activator NlpD